MTLEQLEHTIYGYLQEFASIILEQEGLTKKQEELVQMYFDSIMKSREVKRIDTILKLFEELQEKGFTTIDTRSRGFYHFVKYLDFSQFAVMWCLKCRNFEPHEIEAQEFIEGIQEGGIHLSCGECGSLSRKYEFSHIKNKGI